MMQKKNSIHKEQALNNASIYLKIIPPVTHVKLKLKSKQFDYLRLYTINLLTYIYAYIHTYVIGYYNTSARITT